MNGECSLTACSKFALKRGGKSNNKRRKLSRLSIQTEASSRNFGKTLDMYYLISIAISRGVIPPALNFLNGDSSSPMF